MWQGLFFDKAVLLEKAKRDAVHRPYLQFQSGSSAFSPSRVLVFSYVRIGWAGFFYSRYSRSEVLLSDYSAIFTDLQYPESTSSLTKRVTLGTDNPDSDDISRRLTSRLARMTSITR